jgi:F0F1-type ATP synthase gamma subunit
MSGTMQSLRRQIDSAADLAGVVRAMKALAASSIGQYERAVESLDDYYRTVELGLSVCLRQAGPAVHSTGKRFEFIRGYLFMLLFQACAESLNSENASRLAAMQRAEKISKTFWKT